MSINDGGPAFPPTFGLSGDIGTGMSLRDWFAGQALTSLAEIDPSLPGEAPQHNYVWPAPERLAERRAKWAYLQADAMLAARNSTPTKGTQK